MINENDNDNDSENDDDNNEKRRSNRGNDNHLKKKIEVASESIKSLIRRLTWFEQTYS